MATAKIILVDEDGTVSVTIDFGDEGAVDQSPAHQMAVAMVRSQVGGLEEDCDE